MDNATLSLLNDPIFWTFLLLGIACLIGSALVSYPFENNRSHDEHEEGGIGA